MRSPAPLWRTAEAAFQSRGDWTPVELFRRGAASIESHIRRLILAFIQGPQPRIRVDGCRAVKPAGCRAISGPIGKPAGRGSGTWPSRFFGLCRRRALPSRPRASGRLAARDAGSWGLRASSLWSTMAVWSALADSPSYGHVSWQTRRRMNWTIRS
jgi:hypothetical protein